MIELKYCQISILHSIHRHRISSSPPAPARKLVMEKAVLYFRRSGTRRKYALVLGKQQASEKRKKKEGGRDRRAYKGAALFSVPFAGLHSHGPFPLHHVRDCKQANNNRAVKP